MEVLKLVSILLFCLLGGASHIEAQAAPACTTDDEMTQPQKHISPNKYWICIGPNEALELTCDEGEGFLANDDAFGCVPWSEWPCQLPKPDCMGPNQMKPWRHSNPNHFWVCAQERNAVEVPCVSGGYMDEVGMRGCVPWDEWTPMAC